MKIHGQIAGKNFISYIFADTSPRLSISEESGGIADQLRNVLSQIRHKVDSDEEEQQGADSDEWDDDSD